MRKMSWAAPILIALAIFSCAGARAQSKPPASGSTASALAPHWNHNGSVVSFVSSAGKQKIFYDTPRIGLLDAGVKPGTLLFEGQRTGKTWTGTAYQFYRSCKSRAYPVSGDTSEDLRQITLKGKAPLLDAKCNVTGSRDDVLIFTVDQSAPSKPSKDAPVASAPAANASAQASKDASTASKPVVVTVVAPSAPPETSRTPDKPAAETSNVKSSDAAASDKAASSPAAAPSNAAKAELPPKAPEQESVKIPSSEPVKEIQASATAGADSKPPKSDDSNKESNQAQRVSAAPPSEPPKDTQVAALPGAATGAVKADDAGKSKNSVATGGAANDLKAASKSEIFVIDADKTGALTENKTVPANSTEKMMEIVLKNGRVLRIGRDIESEALLRIISLLER